VTTTNPTTAAELREQAQQIRATAAKRARDIQEAAEREARALEMAAGILEGYKGALTSAADSTNNSTMGQAVTADSNVKTRAFARGRGRSKALADGHKFVRALYDKGLTVTEWAKVHKLSLASVSSWVSTSERGRRRIPIRWAKEIEKEFGKGQDKKPLLPATTETWPNGITE